MTGVKDEYQRISFDITRIQYSGMSIYVEFLVDSRNNRHCV